MNDLCFITHEILLDVGKITSSQNHFGNPIQSQFNTKNNTRVIAQKGGLAILPCVVKVNSPATVRNSLSILHTYIVFMAVYKIYIKMFDFNILGFLDT